MYNVYSLIKKIVMTFEPNANDEFFWLDGFFGLFK